jgi:hypothetical protein
MKNLMKEVLKKLEQHIKEDEERCKKLLIQIQHTNKMLDFAEMKAADLDRLYLALAEFENSISKKKKLIFNMKQKLLVAEK